MPNVLITPHTAGDAPLRDNVIDLRNLGWLWRGEAVLKNQFV
jgi:hypothetical protein